MSASSFAPFGRVVAGYGVVAVLWILWSDALVELLFENIELLAAAQAWKGLLFVLVTTGLLFLFLRRVHARMQRLAEVELEALRREAQTAALLQAWMDSSPDAIFAKDRQGRYLLVNQETERMVGKGVTPMLGLRIQDLLPAEQADKIWEDERRIMREGRIETLEYEVDTSEGRRTFNSIKGPLRDETGTIGVFGMARDITDMVTVRRQLQESEKRYRLLFENNPQPMWVIDLETLEFLAVNDAAVAHYGYSRDEFLSMRLPVVAPPDLVNGLERIMEAKLKAPSVAHQVTGPWPHRLKDGRVIDVEITGRNIEFEGRPARIGLINDVTAKQRVELERDAAHRLLEDVLSRVTDAFVSAGPDQRLVYANDRAARLVGVASPQDMLGHIVWDVFPDSRGTRFEAAYWRARESGRSEVVEDWYQPWGLWLEVRLYPAGDHVAGYITDITARKQAEHELQQSKATLSDLSQRLMAQERFTTRRIAQSLHDQLGQQLSSARLYLDVAMARPGPAQNAASGPLAKASGMLDSAIAHVRDVLREMRPPLLEDQGLAAALDNELRASPASDLGLAVELELGTSVRGIRWTDAVEYAAFMIAREAIGNAVRHAQATRVRVSLDGDAGHLRMRIEDNGKGIEDDDLQGRPGHLGIVGMRERAAAIGADLLVERGAAGGTVVELTREVATP